MPSGVAAPWQTAQRGGAGGPAGSWAGPDCSARADGHGIELAAQLGRRRSAAARGRRAAPRAAAGPTRSNTCWGATPLPGSQHDARPTRAASQAAQDVRATRAGRPKPTRNSRAGGARLRGRRGRPGRPQPPPTWPPARGPAPTPTSRPGLPWARSSRPPRRRRARAPSPARPSARPCARRAAARPRAAPKDDPPSGTAWLSPPPPSSRRASATDDGRHAPTQADDAPPRHGFRHRPSSIALVPGIVVMKFGGTSVADAERLKRAAMRIVAKREQGTRVVAVLCARGKATDALIADAQEVSPTPRPARDGHAALDRGARLLRAVCHGHQRSRPPGDLPDRLAGRHRHRYVPHEGAHPRRSRRSHPRRRSTRTRSSWSPASRASRPRKDVTTLGRGGSDTTAVALAAAIGADVCEIYTDVAGVFTADPRIVPDARKLAVVSFEEMLEMAASRRGRAAAALASSTRATTACASTAGRASTTRPVPLSSDEEETMEHPLITAVTHSTEEARVTLIGVPDTPGVAGRDLDRARRRERQRRHDHPERAASPRAPAPTCRSRSRGRPARRAAALDADRRRARDRRSRPTRRWARSRSSAPA